MLTDMNIIFMPMLRGPESRQLINRLQENVIVKFPLCLLVILPWVKLDLQGVLDRKYRVIFEMLTVLIENLCDNGLVAFPNSLNRSKHWSLPKLSHLTYKNVNVRRAEWMTVHEIQKMASRTIIWHRVWSWSQTVKSILAVIACSEFATEVVLPLCRVLLFVES